MLEHWVSTSRLLAHWGTVVSVCWELGTDTGGLMELSVRTVVNW